LPGVGRFWGIVCLSVAAGLVTAAAAFGHAERPAYYPNFDSEAKVYGPAVGSVPTYRTTGKSVVVCKSDSRKRIGRLPSAKMRARNLALLKRCRYRHIQDAVDHTRNNVRIRILPGVYREEPSRKEPNPDPKCSGDWVTRSEAAIPGPIALGTGGLIGGQGGSILRMADRVPGFEYQRRCQNSQNLIAIIGDGPDDDRKCDHHCNVQIEGTARRQDVLISGQRAKLNVIRADRADGIYLRNFTIEFSDFNNIYALETNGFVFDRITSRYSREYGVLSFASDHGLYQYIDAYGSGDSGVYPGSGPEGHCQRWGIELRFNNSHDNNLGYSGTAGNGVWAHDNRFHHNGTGMTTDSFAAGHPGMPQDCAKWENNYIYSNNLDLFSKQHQTYCAQPIEKRDPKVVCSTFQNPTGTGILIAGGNSNIVRGNYIWDNWRSGVRLLGVPGVLRGEDYTGQSVNVATDQFDNSNGNRITGNHMGVRPDGTRDPNGTEGDFWWDGEGAHNCWDGNVGPRGAKPTTSFPAPLPTCPNPSGFSPGLVTFFISQASCGVWNPRDMQFPPGCNWMYLPPEPK
jgi:hypothetical protein